MSLTIVVAVGDNGVIGSNGQMPWSPTGDMRQFKELTWGHPIVMGRATFESIGRPLPGRTSVVLTRNSAWKAGSDEVLVAGSLLDGLRAAADLDEEVFLIGGAEVFTEALSADLVDRVVLTRVPLSPVGDVFFAPLDETLWQLTGTESFEGTPDYVIETWDRFRPEPQEDSGQQDRQLT